MDNIKVPTPPSLPKKICMVTYSTYETDTRVRRYAEALAKRGDIVEVIAITGGSVPMGEETLCGVRVFRIQRRVRDERGKWGYASRLLRFFISSGKFLTKRNREIRYDLIHVHNIPDFLVFSAWYPKITGAKIILDIHDVVPELFINKFRVETGSILVRILMNIERVSAAFADHVIVANHLWEEKLVRRSVPRDKCCVLLNHVDSDIFYRRERTRKDDKFILIFPGTWQWHQGLDIAIEALAHLKDRVPNAELHLYGGGGDASNLASLAETLGLSDRVKFFEDVSLDRVAEVVANADIGIVPKRADSFGNEAYSTKIMEYMSQGIPVVASRTRIDSYYFDDTNIRFFPSGDAQAMAEAIIEIKENAELRTALVQAGLEYAKANDWDHKKDDYLNLVDALTAKKRLRGRTAVAPKIIESRQTVPPSVPEEANR
jgi:glycosyltransferase involved in cell wall biosynthesis